MRLEVPLKDILQKAFFAEYLKLIDDTMLLCVMSEDVCVWSCCLSLIAALGKADISLDFGVLSRV